MTVRKEILRIIFNWLLKELTPENREWLKKHRSATWEEFSKEGFPTMDNLFSRWKYSHAHDLVDLSLRIQEIMDAKKDRKESNYSFGDGLPISYVADIAKLLEISPEESKYVLLGKIVKKIKKQAAK